MAGFFDGKILTEINYEFRWFLQTVFLKNHLFWLQHVMFIMYEEYL